MLLLDPESGTILNANGAAATYYGYPLGKLLGMNINQINVAEQETISAQMSLAAAGEGTPFTFRHRRADGEVREVTVHSSPVLIEEQPCLFSIIFDVTEKVRAEEALTQLRHALEERVELRTEALEEEIRQRKQVELSLKENEKRLVSKRIRLEEMNTTLKAVIHELEHQRQQIEKEFALNIANLIEPYLNRLNRTGLDPQQQTYLEAIRRNLDTLHFSLLSSELVVHLRLSPTEMQIADLIRQGYASKKIAAIQNISLRTVDKHRTNIRSKLGLSDRRESLFTALNRLLGEA